MPHQPDTTHRITRAEVLAYAAAIALTVAVSHFFPMGFAS